MNLINNAIDSMEERGGQLRIEIAKSTRDRVMVSISDTGTRISSADNIRKFMILFSPQNLLERVPVLDFPYATG